ncbi:hypothetical protein SDC9_202263 [bioreactor metagenome]|uniref:Uncharacterized protein n=1 Tax=bioreactor metagenome TaxID=1076179 RepID=A0A645IUR6_9ZZZZ
MASVLVVVYWKQFIVVHDLGKVCCSSGTHLALVVVMVVNAFVETYSGLHDRFNVNGIIFYSGELCAFYDNCSNILVAKDSPAAAATCLLQSYCFSADIIEAEIESYYIAGPCGHSCRNY